MSEKKGFVVDEGIRDLPFPFRALSVVSAEGQATVANVSVRARVMRDFEPRWIDRFIQLLHSHRDQLGSATNVRAILENAQEKLNANAVELRFDYPFFVEKLTPVDKEKCLVKYACSTIGKTPSLKGKPTIRFEMNAPIITTYPESTAQEPKDLFGQLSIVRIELESDKPIYPENIAEMVDEHALQPIYSFLTERDQMYAIKKIHSQYKSSVTTVEEIKEVLAREEDITHYTVNCFNYGMLHNYSTLVSVERSMWVPFSIYQEESI